MQLGYAFLARFAETNPDNTVTTIGGDFDTFRSPAFPAVAPIALVIKLVGMADWEGKKEPLLFSLDIRNPSGESILDSPVVSLMQPKPTPKSRSAVSDDVAKIVFNLGPVPLAEPGGYKINVSVGQGSDAIQISLPLSVEKPIA